jgi:hypothetical protein
MKRFVGAFYGTHNEGNTFPDLDSVGTLFPNFLFLKMRGGGALPKSLNQEMINVKLI